MLKRWMAALEGLPSTMGYHCVPVAASIPLALDLSPEASNPGILFLYRPDRYSAPYGT